VAAEGPQLTNAVHPLVSSCLDVDAGRVGAEEVADVLLHLGARAKRAREGLLVIVVGDMPEECSLLE